MGAVLCKQPVCGPRNEADEVARGSKQKYPRPKEGESAIWGAAFDVHFPLGIDTSAAEPEPTPPRRSSVKRSPRPKSGLCSGEGKPSSPCRQEQMQDDTRSLRVSFKRSWLLHNPITIRVKMLTFPNGRQKATPSPNWLSPPTRGVGS